uniref:Abundant larval transcript-1 n=2 Tax=Litomosoides sigmodontis TaxID=42156 RepID=Q1PCF3_LITSI|nr:abundant larval transcript-1 [Litomosoides sigmodontis]
MNKVLIIFGLVILLVTPLRAQEEDEMDDDEEFDGEDEGNDDSSSEGGDDGGDDSNDGGSNGGEDSEYVTKGKFVETDGKKKQCNSHEACYDQREPQAWCILKKGQSWTNKGCFCEEKMNSCVIERKNGGNLEYAYCAPQEGWQCSYD